MKNFSSEKEFQKFLFEKHLIEKGEGSEGKFYYSKIDKLGYKIFFNDIDYPVEQYNVSKIILDEEVQMESFLFPKELLIVDGVFRGYVTRYQKNNLLSDENMFGIDVSTFDFEALKQAYKQMKVDISLLTKKGIYIYDLANNLVFDGDRLYAIDTCSYTKSKDPQLLKHNIESLHYAIDTLMDILLLNYEEKLKTRSELGLSVTEYFNYITKKMNSYKKKIYTI